MSNEGTDQSNVQNFAPKPEVKPATASVKKPALLSDFHLNRIAGVFELLAKWEKSAGNSAPPTAN